MRYYYVEKEVPPPPPPVPAECEEAQHDMVCESAGERTECKTEQPICDVRAKEIRSKGDAFCLVNSPSNTVPQNQVSFLIVRKSGCVEKRMHENCVCMF